MKFPDWLTVYGDTSFRGECPEEEAEQGTFFNQLRILHPKLAAIALHPKNEQKLRGGQFSRHARDKRSGFVKGASDIIIPGGPALVIELKRLDHTQCKWQDGQQEYLEAAQDAGAMVCVALGYEAAIAAVNDWLKRYR